MEVTNSPSADLDCLLTVTSRYSPVWIGSQKSTATSFQGSLGMGVMRTGSHSCDTLTTWQGWQPCMCASTILSSPGNHTLAHRYSLVYTLVAFVHKLDYLIPQRPGKYNSWTSDYDQPFYNSQPCENGVISSGYGFLQV